jgi:transposase
MTKIATGGHPDLKMVNPVVTTIDIGSTMHIAAVNPDACDAPVRAFGTFTQDLHDLADWFEACGVTGCKTDVSDAGWLRQLHSYGLLRGSFRPASEIATLRAYLRQRERLVEYAAIPPLS